ncbi:MAG: NAD-dependent epimerase/dehydratase family protein [Geminicoccaceae bacterium]|nr:NAD-dependent epimerase/dehydratase family protein [Geminicoccaceae bacterium]
MRLLITGGTGFIGARLAVMARDAGHEVRVTGLVNTPAEATRKEALDAAGIEVLVRSLEPPVPAALVEGVDAIVHLAAAQHEMNVPDAHFEQINLRATQGLFEAARESAVGRFVQGSTIGVYGAREGTIDETTPVAPDNVYGRTKLAAERWLRAQDSGPEVVVIRIGETYGPGDMRLLKLFQGVARGRFPRLGKGRNLHHPVYVDDLVRGLLAAARAPIERGEVFLFAGPEPVTTDQMVACVAAALDRPAPGLRLPLGPFKVVATVLESTLRPLGIQPPLHRRRLDFFTKSLAFSTERARHRLGFVPEVGFAEGARLTAAWYRSQGLL